MIAHAEEIGLDAYVTTAVQRADVLEHIRAELGDGSGYPGGCR